MKKQLIAAIAAMSMIFALSACGDEEKQVEIISSGDRLYVEVGDEISVTAHTKKQEAVRWSCEDGNIAVITNDGKLTGVANGITVVTAKTDSGYDHIGLVVGNGVKGSEVVPVANAENSEGETSTTTTPTAKTNKNYNKNSKITDISLSLNGMTEDETLILKNNDVAKFKVTVSPADCDDVIEFKSSDSSVAEVDADGVVTPVSRGTVTITATAPNGVEDTFKVFVR